MNHAFAIGANELNTLTESIYSLFSGDHTPQQALNLYNVIIGWVLQRARHYKLGVTATVASNEIDDIMTIVSQLHISIIMKYYKAE